MTVVEFFDKLTVGGLAGWVVALLFVFLSIVQIAPVRLNPWDNIFAWLGRKLNGETRKQLTELNRQVTDLWISNHRQSILTFARECRSQISHDSEEWANILNLCEEYEKYTEDNRVTNGVVRENTRYIRELYQELSRERKI